MITEKDLKNFKKWDSIIEKNESKWTDEFISLIEIGSFHEHSLREFLFLKVFIKEFESTLIKDAILFWEANENKVLDEDDYYLFCMDLLNHTINTNDDDSNPFQEYQA